LYEDADDRLNDGQPYWSVQFIFRWNNKKFILFTCNDVHLFYCCTDWDSLLFF
jgi:hypothetical protein